jgi:hypothetical protein
MYKTLCPARPSAGSFSEGDIEFIFLDCEFLSFVIFRIFFMHVSVDSELLLVDFAFFDTFVCGKLCYKYIGIISLLITFQEQIDSVTAEAVGNVGEKDWIDIKTEKDCIQSVGRVKCEQEVSVLCW